MFQELGISGEAERHALVQWLDGFQMPNAAALAEQQHAPLEPGQVGGEQPPPAEATLHAVAREALEEDQRPQGELWPGERQPQTPLRQPHPHAPWMPHLDYTCVAQRPGRNKRALELSGPETKRRWGQGGAGRGLMVWGLGCGRCMEKMTLRTGPEPFSKKLGVLKKKATLRLLECAIVDAGERHVDGAVAWQVHGRCEVSQKQAQCAI
jgi:hypothetical protein